MIEPLRRPYVRLAAVVALQALILLSVIAFKQYTIWTGETVLLRTVPVDPRDPLRGDYAVVRYEISQLDSRDLAGDEYVEGDVYVELQEGDDGYWHAVAIHEDRERSFGGTVLIKGEITSVSHLRAYRIYDVEYGIEQVFIPEGSGAVIPFPGEDDVAVAVKVDRFGNAVPRHFVVNGEELPLRRR
jgi:uncharacterized membrane-anchored protein